MNRKNENKRGALRKSCALYATMLVVWVVLTGLLWWKYSEAFSIYAGAGRYAVVVFLVLNAIFISYFWLNGAKDFIYVTWYYVFKRGIENKFRPVQGVNVDEATDKVVMIYCTCNDFDGESLKKCLAQEYPYADAVILDDSYSPEYIKAVDDFAAEYGVKVVRRENRKGFKAGNINNYLQSEEVKRLGYKYFVVLDSDEIIPKDFIRKCLKYFAYYSNVGIVQASHVATRNRNFFMKLFNIGVDSHWNTYQSMKHLYGFSSLLGHGAMVSMECYRAAGGFPEVVAEDLCLSIEARNCGYTVAYAPDIICEEEYPVDYVAFKKRHSKWTQGNLEFIKKYTGKIIASKMKWYEKLDIMLFTYNLPLTAVFALFIVINVIILPVVGVDAGSVYPVWMIIPTAVFFIAPMLNDVFFWLGRLNFFRFVLYCACVVLLYGSMFFITFSSSLMGLFGKKAKFVVTPKQSGKMTFKKAISIQYKEIIFSTALIVIAGLCSWYGSYASTGYGDVWAGIFSVALMAGTGYLSVFLLFLSNIRYDEERYRRDDEKTIKLTLKRNGLL